MEWWILALISALFSALAAIVEKKILFKEKALQMTFILGIFNMILCIPFFFVGDISLNNPALIAVFVKSLFGALAFLCVMHSIKTLELSEALPLLTLTPGFVAIFAFFILGQKLSHLEILGLVLLSFGAFVLEVRKGWFNNLGKEKLEKYKFILLALGLFTASSILSKLILEKYKLSPELFMGFQHLYLAIIFLVVYFVFYKSQKPLKLSLKYSGIFIFVLAILTVIYRYMEILAIKSAYSTALVIAIKRISVLFAVIIGGKIFKEKELMRKTIATIILVVGALLIIRF